MSVTINVVSAQLTRDTQTFSNMDPYCILKLGSQSQRTKTKNEAGKKPVWNEILRFSNTDNQLKVIVMDEDNVADDTVGEGDVNIAQYRNNPTEQQVIVQLYYKGRAAGKVLLRIMGAGNGQGGNQGGQNNNTWGNTQPNNQFGNQNFGNNPYGGQGNQWGQQNNMQGANNTWGQQQPPPPNNYVPTQPNSAWGQQGGNGWGQQINSWGQTNPNQGYQQPPNQYNQPPNQYSQPPPIQGQNTWNQPPPSNQWGAPTQGQQSQGWNQPPVVPPVQPSQPVNPNQNPYPTLDYKPPINNNNPYAQGGNTGYGTTPPPNIPGSNPQNLNLPFQLIGGMQGLLSNNTTQPGNPYYK